MNNNTTTNQNQQDPINKMMDIMGVEESRRKELRAVFVSAVESALGDYLCRTLQSVSNALGSASSVPPKGQQQEPQS